MRKKNEKEIIEHKKKTANTSMDIAIVGMSCRFPKAKNHNEFWNNLILGRDCVDEIPEKKWPVEDYFAEDIKVNNKTYCRCMGCLDDIDLFDNKFFNISPREAKSMEPQQRLLLQESWHCMEDSGIALDEFQQKKTAVYIGAISLDPYQTEQVDIHTGTGIYYFMLANKVSYYLGLTGESQTIDTGCSSSFSALHTACQSLLNHSSDYAFVGGINLHLSPRKYIIMSKGRIISPTGRCHTFSKDADGYVAGEGVAFVLLQPLDKAIEQNNHILGVIKGCAVNYCGKGLSVSAPNVKAQKEVILSAYERAGFTPDTVSYVEAHGTGTSLGDPIEVEALRQVFGQYTNKKNFCRLGSVKSNIGHLEGCSAMAGLIKVILMMKHKKIVPTLHVNEVNPIINIKDSAFEIAYNATDWNTLEDNVPRRAGISSFGFGGSNSHVLLEEYNTNQGKKTESEYDEKAIGIYLFSAKTERSLKLVLDTWKSYVTQDEDFIKVSQNDISNVLIRGRKHFPIRVGFTADSKEEFLHILKNTDATFSVGASKKGIVIDPCRYVGMSSVPIGIKSLKCFINTMENISLKLSEMELTEPVWEELHQDVWQKNQELNTFLIEYAVVNTLYQLGVKWHCITGFGQSSLIALVVSGMINLKNAIALLYHGISIDAGQMLRPEISFYDWYHARMIYPYSMNIKYLKKVISPIRLNGEIYTTYIEKARILYNKQFTFKKYMDEWQEYLADGESIVDILSVKQNTKNGSIVISGKELLVLLMIKSSLEKVNLKWKLKDELSVDNPVFEELLHLCIDDIISKKNLSQLLLNQVEDSVLDSIAKIGTENIIKNPIAYDYRILREEGIYELDNQEEWLEYIITSQEFCPSNQENFEWVYLSEITSIRDFLLRAWLMGDEIQWNNCVRDDYHKVELPVYCFDETSFWSPQIEQNTDEIQKEKGDGYRFSGNEYVLRDHIVGSERILPGAAYLDYISGKAAQICGMNNFRMENIIWMRAFRFSEVNHTLYYEYQTVESGVRFVFKCKGAQDNLMDLSEGIIITGTKNINGTRLTDKRKKEIVSRCTVSMNKDEFYRKIASLGLHYGKSFQVVTGVSYENNVAIADLELPAFDVGEKTYEILHPSLIDGAFQTILCCDEKIEALTSIKVPFSIDVFSVFRKLDQKVTVYAYRDDNKHVNAEIYNENGELCIAMENVTLRSFQEASVHNDLSVLVKNTSKSSSIAPISSQNTLIPVAALEAQSDLYMKEIVYEILEEVLQIDISEFDDEMPFTDMGIDSILEVEIISRINKKLNVNLKPTDLYNYTNLGRLLKYIGDLVPEFDALMNKVPYQIGKSDMVEADEVFTESEDAKETERVDLRMDGDDEIAVIGIACHFPDAANKEEFWNNLTEGKNSVRKITRWKEEEFFSENEEAVNRSYCNYAAMIDDYDKFDPQFFNISPKEAELMDPQQRLFLEEAWNALEDAGYSSKRLDGQRCSVYVGCSQGDYYELLTKNSEEAHAFELIGNTISILPARVSYQLNLKGASLAIDTACSSSLVALHLACNEIRNGAADMAVVGGSSIYSTPKLHVLFSKSNMLSKTGACHTFDQAADGFVPGEGVGVVIIKSLKKAREDKDQIYGIISASGMNQDGKTNGITAPNTISQANLEDDVYCKANINPDKITYIEAHGTGTKLGDPIEIDALTQSFRKYTDRKQFCAIGSVKTNIGHTIVSAGIAGLIKILLCMEHKKMVPQVGLQQENNFIDFKNSPFYVNKDYKDWKVPEGETRIAALSSFGFSGTNVHVVIRENREAYRIPNTITQGYVIPFSAKTEEGLYKSYENFIKWYDVNRNEKLCDIAYTLCKGRTDFPVRGVYVVYNILELLEQMQNVVNYGESQMYLQNKIIRSQNIDKKTDRKIYEDRIKDSSIPDRVWKSAEAFLNGTDEALWKEYIDTVIGKIISLPTYPFAKESFWVTQKEDIINQGKGQIHPLLQFNVSTIYEQVFTSYFTKHDRYLLDHEIFHKNILPGAGYLEMACQAGTRSTGEKIQELQDVIWSVAFEAEDMEKELKTHIYQKDDAFFYEISSINADGNKSIHSQGRLVTGSSQQSDSRIYPDEIRRKLHKRNAGIELYRSFEQNGYRYGSYFRTVTELYGDDNEAFAVITLPEESKKDFSKYILHPSLIDGAFQAVRGITAYSGVISYIPFHLGKISILDKLCDECYVHITNDSKEQKADNFACIQIEIADKSGNVLVKLKDFILALGKKTSVNENHILYAGRCWEKQICKGSNKLRLTDCVVTGSDWGLAKAIHKEHFTGKDDSDYMSWLQELDKRGEIPSTFIYTLPSGMDQDIEKLLSESIYPLLYLNQAILKKADHKDIRIYILYRDNGEGNPMYSAIGAFSRTVNAEKKDLWNHIIQIPQNWTMSQITEMLQQDNTDSEEIVYMDHDRYVRKNILLEHYEKNVSWNQNGVFVITGGIGSLGMIFARYLAASGKAKIALLGRRPENDEIREKLNFLRKSGSEIIYKSVDITNREMLDNAIAEIKEVTGRITGVIHAAGIISDKLTIRKKTDQFTKVVMTKIAGARNLDEVTKNEPLDFFVMFSSIASVVGNPGQSDYAYANGYMNDFAVLREASVNRKERSGKTVSIAWPLWKDGGMHVSEETEQWIFNHFGFSAFTEHEGIEAWETIMNMNIPMVSLATGDTNKIKQNLGIEAVTVQSSKREINSEAVRQQIIKDIKNIISSLLHVASDDMDEDVDFEEYGVDSISMMSALSAIEKLYQVPVDANSIIENNTIGTWADYLLHTGITPKEETVSTKTEVKNSIICKTPQLNTKKIAVIAVSCRFPKSGNVESFWDNLVNERSLISDDSIRRWNADEFYDEHGDYNGKSYLKNAGLLNDIYGFDADFFHISEVDALVMDPHQRMLLELTQELLGRAGYKNEEIAGQKVGVFIGGGESRYIRRNLDEITAEGRKHFVVNTIQNMMAARISDHYDLKGPSMTIDTACSSSLVAVHEAVNSIRNGESTYAIAGGIELHINPDYFKEFSQARVLSRRGIPAVFDENADGMVLGEGAGLVLLKDYESAICDGDRIMGVILGSSMNNDGHTMGLTVPSQEGQKEVIRAAFKDANIRPDTISYLEAHGTGTLLGDPIEIQAVSQVFREYTNQKAYCGVGSVKSNMGHLLRASGIASFIKVMLSLQYQTLPATLHLKKPHQRFRFEQSPFYPVMTTEKWKPIQGCRRACISSFGFGGTNCHMIVEEFLEKERTLKHVPLPDLHFNHKQYSLDTEKIVITDDNIECLEEIMDKLERGEINSEEAMWIMGRLG